MKKNFLGIFLLFLIIGAMKVNAQAFLFVENVKMMPGETKEISINLTNSVDIQMAGFTILLSEGLSLVDAYYDEDYDQYKVVKFVDERKPKGGQLEETKISDTEIDVMAYAFSASADAVFKGSEGAILTFQVKASDNMPLGEYQIVLKGDDKVTTPDAVGYNSEDVVAKVNVYQNVDVKVTAGANGTVSEGGTYETGTEITLTATPNEGYHFVKWSDGSTENPYTFVVNEAKDLVATFEVNKYEVVYTLDGAAFKTDSVAFGAQITTPEAPAKEGYTFAGWGEVPATMPAKDLALNGTYTINKYNLIYKVDGVEYKKVEVEYGAAITAEALPVKEGHTFSGWSEIPATMPAKDVEVTGTFTANKYEVVYTIEGESFKKDSVVYGTAITTPEAPAREGYTFAGWGEVPATMPAKDLALNGTYTINKYNLIYKVDGVEYKK
ncbi:MAG: InlB B-repeat-containing protein, partial [Bacteroidaceae bacterium]|nr:InlB B-repeat-containing protein [Bacteroidaceae bacterium]